MKLGRGLILACVTVAAVSGTAAAGQDWDRYYHQGRLRAEIRREVRDSLREARRAVRDARREAFRAREARRDRVRAHREFWRDYRHDNWRHWHWRD